MAGILRNLRVALKEPEVIGQYARWMATRLVSRDGPSIWCSDRLRLAYWMDFSECYWTRQLSLLNEPDRKLMQGVVAKAKGHKVAIDVGANVGLFSLNMVDAGFDEIHAFEPDPKTFFRLIRNIGLNGLHDKIRLNCLGVGEKFTLSRFVIAGNAGTHHITPNANGSPVDHASIQVATIALDDYCAQFNIDHVDFVKIDVEGYEPWVIRGMKHLLTERRIGMFIIEICEQNLRQAGTSSAELEQLIRSTGYGFYEISDDGTVGRELTTADLQAVEQTKFGSIDVVCVPRA